MKIKRASDTSIRDYRSKVSIKNEQYVIVFEIKTRPAIKLIELNVNITNYPSHIYDQRKFLFAEISKIVPDFWNFDVNPDRIVDSIRQAIQKLNAEMVKLVDTPVMP